MRHTDDRTGAACTRAGCKGQYQSTGMYTDPDDAAMGSDELHYHQYQCTVCGSGTTVELNPVVIPLYTQSDSEKRQRREW